MKFLADMGISPRSVTFLHGLGHDAVHLHAQGLDRMEDSAIMSKAQEEGRVLLTHDLDFGELIAASGARLPSVVIFRLRNMRPERVNRYLESIVSQHTELLEQGAIILPDDFATLEEFWGFWDTHSSADYEEGLEIIAADMRTDGSAAARRPDPPDRRVPGRREHAQAIEIGNLPGSNARRPLGRPASMVYYVQV
jgi:predicted nuclease of predicted toxin-antitoxin system